jgi:hypothetical protein
MAGNMAKAHPQGTPFSQNVEEILREAGFRQKHDMRPKEPMWEPSKTLFEVRKGCRNSIGEYGLSW